MIEVRSAPPRNIIRSFCRRHQLIDSTAPERIDRHFLRALRGFDRQLELYWHPYQRKWLVYRCSRKGGCASDDHLVLEVELCGPNGEYRSPGPWVIDYLRELDRTRGGAVDMGTSFRQYQRKIQADLAAVDEAKSREADTLGQDWASELIKYGYGRASVHVNRA